MHKSIKITTLSLFALFICTTNVSFAYEDYTWPDYVETEIPDSLKDEEALFISNVKTIDFYNEKGTSFVVFQRIYINSDKAAKDLSTRRLYVDNGVQSTKFYARTLKQNGTEIQLESSEIVERYATGRNKYGDQTIRLFELKYPNVQKGDIIDLSYEINLENYALSRLMLLESFLPSLYSRITIRNMSSFDITAYPVNNMIPMDIRYIDGVQTASWEKKGVGVVKTSSFNATPPTSPYFVYNLWHRDESITYETVYFADLIDYPKNFGKKQHVKSFFADMGVINPEEDSFLNLIKIIKSLESDFSWNQNRSNFANSKTAKFLTDKKVDDVLFFRYIMEYLNGEGIKYDRCFTKSLLDGRFEHGFVSFEQLSRRFLTIYDKEGQMHFLFPPTADNRFYYLDEIPFYIEGNQSIALHGKGDFLEEQFAIEIPTSEAKLNTHFANILIDATPKDFSKYSLKRRDVFKGQYSYLTRNGNADKWLKERGVLFDKSKKLTPKVNGNFYPYEIEFNYEGEAKDYFTQKELGTLLFSAEELYPNGVFLSDEMDEEYGTYLILPFLKQDEMAIFIRSENDLSVLDDELLVSFSNSVGTIKYEAIQMNATVIKFKLNIEVHKRIIDGSEQVEEFKSLIQKYNDIKSKKWTVKTH